MIIYLLNHTQKYFGGIIRRFGEVIAILKLLTPNFKVLALKLWKNLNFLKKIKLTKNDILYVFKYIKTLI